jgi:hypothetical protein
MVVAVAVLFATTALTETLLPVLIEEMPSRAELTRVSAATV